MIFTTAQIAAIILILKVFGVDQATIDIVQADLSPQVVQTTQTSTTTPDMAPVAIQSPSQGVPQPIPVQQPAGPDRGLRRRELIPHQAVGGAVHRSEAVAEHGEG